MPRTVGALKTTISLDDTQFQNSMQGINRQLRGLKAETRAVTSSGTGFARGVTEMRAKADVLNRTLEVQRAKVSELRRQYEESKRSTGENSRETQLANVQYQRAVAEMNKTENALKGLTAEIERQTNPWHQLSQEMDQIGSNMQKYGQTMTSFGRNMTTRVTLPILGLGAGMLKVGMDFEQGMSQVQALTQGTAEEMKLMSDQAKELGATTRFSATEAAEGMAFLGMAGWETSAILKGMPGLLSLAAAGNMDLGRAADITSNIMSAFNIEAEKAGFVADVLAHASANANTNVEQMGEAMKYVAPTASTLGISIEDTSAAIMAFGDAGIQGGMAGRAFGTSLLRLADPSEKIAKEMDKLKVSFFDAEGSMKSLPDIIEQLENGMKGYTDQQRAASLSVLFGAEAQRHWSILLDQGSSSLRKNSEELRNSEGAAKQMADTMMDNAHGAMVEFKSAAEGIGIAFAEHMIPTVTDFINKGTELVRKFGELDDSTQKNIIKMGLFAAAIGPTALVVGNLTTALGSLFKVGSNVAGMLAGSTGLIARFGAMGAAGGPVLMAAAGVGFLSYKMIDAYQEANKLYDVSTKLADEMYEQYEANTVLIDSFDELRQKSKLTNEQFADYLDLQTRIANETDPEKIEVMQQEMEMLQKYSGLSNEELEKMVKYNNDVVEALPEATIQITEQGNRVADTTDKLRDYNEEVRRMASRELEQQFYKALSNDRKLREQIAEAQREYNTLVEYEEMLRDTILGLNSQSLESLEENLRLEAEKIEQSLTSLDLTEEEYNLRLDELELIKTLLQNMELGEEHLRSHLANIMQQVDEQKEFVNEKEKELNKINEIVERMAEQQLIAAGISDEQARQLINDGKTIDFINERIKKLQDEKRELDSKYTLEERSTEEYREQAENINKQIGRLKTAKSNIQDLTRTARTYNDELGKQVEKRVGIYTNPSIESLNSLLARPINKQIRMQGHDFYAAYADGTPSGGHPGGLFLAGEEGWELGRMGNKWEVLNAGFYDRPRGYEVFTHEQSKRIMRSLQNIPAYAGGTNMRAETNRIVNREQPIESDTQIIIQNMVVRDETDIHKISRELDSLRRNSKRRMGFA